METEGQSPETSTQYILGAPEYAQPGYERPETLSDDNDDVINDVDGDQSNIYEFDLANRKTDDTLYGYAGLDGNGDPTVGFGLLDFENPDENAGLQGVEILTAEAEVNRYDGIPSGVELDAQSLEFDTDISGHSVTFSGPNAGGNVGLADEDGRFGAIIGANVASVDYSNGDPSPESDSDISFDGGLSAGVGGGFNIVHSDPDNDGVSNTGFEFAYGPVSFGVSTEIFS